MRHPSVTLRQRRNKSDTFPPHCVAVSWLRGAPYGAPFNGQRCLVATTRVEPDSGVSSRTRCRGFDGSPFPDCRRPEVKRRKALRLGVCPPRRADSGRACLPSIRHLERRRTPPVAPCSREHRAAHLLTRSGAHSRKTHEESSRPHRRAHLFGGPAATGCQRLARGERRRLSSRHSRGPSICPRERVLKSFP